MLLDSVDKKLQIVFVFQPFLLYFHDMFYHVNVPLDNIFRSKNKLLNFQQYLKSYARLKKQARLLKIGL